MNLHETLQVQVSHLLTILYTEKLGQLRVRHNAALEVRVKATVGLDVCCKKLGYIRLAAEGLARDAHKRAQFIADGLGL